MSRFTDVMMRKVRGVRVMNLVAGGCLLLVVLGVYGSKDGAGAEAAKIADTNRQIVAEDQRVRLLRAERAYLTQPERLRRLSAQYLDMQPVKPAHELSPDALALARPAATPTAPPPTAPPPQATQ